MRRILWAAVLVAAAVGATIYAAKHGAPSSAAAASSAAPPAPKPRDYGPAPDFQVQGLDSTDFKGRKVMLTFFASWCAPCKIEHPVLMKLSKSVPIWGMDMMDTPTALDAFFKAEGNPFSRIGIDPSGTTGIAWGVDGIPVTFIVGANGHLIYRHFGPIDQDEVDKVILPLMKAK